MTTAATATQPMDARSSSDVGEPLTVRVAAVSGVIILSGVLVFFRLRDTFYYGNDDLLQFFTAKEFGFSQELLTLNVFGHFGPVNRLGHLWLLQLGLDPLAGTLMATALIGILLVAISALTYELGLSLFRRLLIVAAAGGSLAFLDNGHWADSALHVFPALIITYVVVALHLRGIRTGQQRWHVISVLVFPLGLLVQERGAFALPLIVLIDLLLLWSSLPLRERLRNLWSVRWPLAAMTAIGALAAYLIQRNYSVPGEWPAPDTVGRTVLLAFTNYFLPQVVGYEPDAQLPLIGQWLVLALIAVVCALLVVMNRRNSGPVLFLLSTFALYWGFLIFSPILIPDNVIWTASRLGNAVYVTVPSLIAIGSLHGPAGWSAPGRSMHQWRLLHPRRWLALAVASAVAVAAFFTVMGARLADRDWGPDRQANSFFATAAATRAQWADPSVTVLPLRGPVRIAPEEAWSAAYAEHQFLLTLMAPEWVSAQWPPGEPTDRAMVLNNQGQLLPVLLQPVATTLTPTSTSEASTPAPTPSLPNEPLPTPPRPNAAATCVNTRSDQDSLTYDVTPAVSVGPVFARLTYQLDQPGSLRTVGFDEDSYHASRWPVPLAVGTHTIAVPLPLVPFLPLEQGQIDRVRFDSLPIGSDFCVTAIEVVRPLVVQPDGTCATINAYGEPLDVRACR